jgi:hypothetical protein
MVENIKTDNMPAKMLCLFAYILDKDLVLVEEAREMKSKWFLLIYICSLSQNINIILVHKSNKILGLLFRNERKVIPALKAYEKNKNLYDF